MKRILKVISVGEHRKLKQKGQIRLEGKWLVEAGLLPEKHVEITSPQVGVLVIKCLEK